MKIARSTSLLAIACLLVGLAIGILVQRTFPVGRILLALKELTGASPESNLDEAFVPVSPLPAPELLSLAGKIKVTPLPGAVESAKTKLEEQLQANLPDEEAFRKSEPVETILNAVRTARTEGNVAEVEYRFDRIFRESNLRSFDSPEAAPQSGSKTAERIAEFSSLLAEQGTHLIYCPVPNPLDNCLAPFSGLNKTQSARPDHTRLLLELLDRGVDLIDLRPEFGRQAVKGRIPFHRFDHHWTPGGIELAADIVQREIDARFDTSKPFGTEASLPISYRWRPVPASDWNLELAPRETLAGTLFVREVFLGDSPIPSISSSPIWVMGDSMLLEVSPNRSEVTADFGSHLSARLKAPVYSLGRPGTADIRQAYFLNTTLADSRPKLLIWIHSDEEVTLPEIKLEALKESGERISGTARVTEVSPIPNAKTSPYPDAVFSFRAELRLPRDQTKTVIVYAWGFRNRSPEQLAKIQIGDELSLDLQSWFTAIQKNEFLQKVQIIDQLDNTAGEPIFWAADPKP